MLFDLQGKRRRLVQGTYLVLAVLMGGGLVLFGVGSGDISGGLFDAITGKDSGSTGSSNSAVTKRIERDEKAVKLNPKNTNALTDLVRAHYQLATDNADQTTGVYNAEGKAELGKAGAAWEKYLVATKKPDASLAALMVQAYGTNGLGKADGAARASEILALARPSAAAYLQLAQYASQAGQARKAQLAGQKAVALAPKSQKKLVKEQLKGILSASGTPAPSG